MHTTILYPIASHSEYRFGICSSCASPLTKRHGDVNGPHCLIELYCATCKTVCAETPDSGDLQHLPALLATRGKLIRGNVDGMPEPLKRILARH
jgi:hypothetical protein